MLATFRAVLRDGSFGELHGGGQVAAGRHVFAMVQSLHGDGLSAIAAGRLRRRHRRRVPPRRRRRPTTGCSITCSRRSCSGSRRRPSAWTARTSPTGSTAGSPSSCGSGRPSTRVPRAVPVLRRRRRHRPRAAAAGGAAATRARSSSNVCHRSTTLARRQAARGDPADRARPGAMRALGFCVSKEHAALHGPQVHRGGPPERRAHRRRRPTTSGAPALRDSRPGELRCCSPSTSSARASTCPTSTACSCCARPTAPRVRAAARPRPAPARRQEPSSP